MQLLDETLWLGRFYIQLVMADLFLDACGNGVSYPLLCLDCFSSDEKGRGISVTTLWIKISIGWHERNDKCGMAAKQALETNDQLEEREG